MNRSKYTDADIMAENQARNELAYHKIKEYIISKQNRFIGACGYNLKRIIAQSKPNGNQYLDKPNSNIVKYLTIPTQTLKGLAGWYIHSTRQGHAKRIPIKPIIDRLTQEGIINPLKYSANAHRAVCYALNVESISKLRDRIKGIQHSEAEKMPMKQEQKHKRELSGKEYTALKQALISCYEENKLAYEDVMSFADRLGITLVLSYRSVIRNEELYQKWLSSLESWGL